MLAPMPYYGGKARIAAQVWQYLGDCPNYAEPFLGSAAVLLARPDTHQWWDRVETVNDADGLLSNFWRAVQADPDAVAQYADWPVNENDLHARHGWLVGQRESLQARLEGDSDYYDAKAAGWWIWGACAWIGGGWCSGEGPWVQRDGLLVREPGHEGNGTKRERPHLGNSGQGINRQLPHLNSGQGIKRQLPHLGDSGQGINRKLDGSIAPNGAGHAAAWSDHLRAVMQQLSDRLRRVRVCSGDWSRVLGPTPTTKLGLTGVFLDPPYGDSVGRDMALYSVDSGTVAADVRQWALEHGNDPQFRIVLCGYLDEHDLPGWSSWQWKAGGGYGSQGNGRGRENAKRECLWKSPHCQQSDLFAWGSTQ